LFLAPSLFLAPILKNIPPLINSYMTDSPSRNVKGKAKKLESFLFKLVNSFESKKNDKPAIPPTPPPETNQLDAAFNSLSISPSQQPPSLTPPFVGGFHPGYSAFPEPYTPNHAIAPSAVPTHFSSSSPNLPRPMAVSSSFGHPQSMTMQMALLPPDDPFLATARPHSNPIFSSAAKPNSSVSTPAKPSFGRLPGSPSTPSKSNKSEISSTVSTPSGKAGQEQCSGVTKAGKRCARMVKTTPALSGFGSDDGDSPSIPRFCHQHTKELLGPSGFYGRKTGEWVNFEEWIPPYLQQETQVSLRVEMEKAHSQSDVPGYIYTFEIREGQTETIKLKVGRAVNIVKRIDQWSKQMWV